MKLENENSNSKLSTALTDATFGRDFSATKYIRISLDNFQYVISDPKLPKVASIADVFSFKFLKLHCAKSLSADVNGLC